jgi:hypothetical protein
MSEGGFYRRGALTTMLVKNVKLMEVFLKDQRNIGGYHHVKADDMISIDSSEQFHGHFCLYFSQGFRVSEYRRMDFASLRDDRELAEANVAKLLPTSDFTIIVCQPIDVANHIPRPDAMSFQFGFQVCGYATLVHNNRCIKCTKHFEEPIMLCSGCKIARYCSAECQNSDRKQHKMMCKQAKSLREQYGEPRDSWTAEEALPPPRGFFGDITP